MWGLWVRAEVKTSDFPRGHLQAVGLQAHGKNLVCVFFWAGLLIEGARGCATEEVGDLERSHGVHGITPTIIHPTQSMLIQKVSLLRSG